MPRSMPFGVGFSPWQGIGQPLALVSNWISKRVKEMKKVFCVVLFGLCAALPARGVVILDSTWAENGGAKGAWDMGFEAHFELAQKARFAAIMGLWDGAQYSGSGTWIGNDDQGHGYVLTAAHNFDGGATASTWEYISRNEQTYRGVKLWVNPNRVHGDDSTDGWDMAIVQLDRPVTDAGPAPLIYAGRNELGEVATMTGYGSRGIGSVGESDKFYSAELPAAARNVIDEVDGENGANQLVVDFDSEDGDANALDGDAYPVDPLEGILGSGDSGGATWIMASGGWAIAGVNVWGDDSVYGSVSGFARVSTQTEWIKGIFAGARFTD